MGANASTRIGDSPQLARQLLDHLLTLFPAPDASMVLGLSGLQGSGKSTLAAALAGAAEEREIPAAVVALDDYYLGRRERSRLARDAHPLLATRGVPGTHEVARLEAALDALRGGELWSPLRLPRFDKGRDTRVAPSRWKTIRNRPRLVIFEGWCVGLAAQREPDLTQAVNALEREEDADGRWRRWVNWQLAGDYARLWRKLDRLLVLQAPGFEVVRGWRDQQERALRARSARHAMSSRGIARFLAHTERLSRHALRSLPGRADVLVELGHRREVRAIRTGPTGRRGGQDFGTS